MTNIEWRSSSLTATLLAVDVSAPDVMRESEMASRPSRTFIARQNVMTGASRGSPALAGAGVDPAPGQRRSQCPQRCGLAAPGLPPLRSPPPRLSPGTGVLRTHGPGGREADRQGLRRLQ